MNIRILRGLCVLGILALAGSFVWAGRIKGIDDGLREMMREPWAVVTLLDAYVGLFVLAAWVFHLERRAGVAAAWTVAMLLLGNIVALAYLLRRATRARSIAEIVSGARQEAA